MISYKIDGQYADLDDFTIAKRVFNEWQTGKHGDFFLHLADAFFKADAKNQKRIVHTWRDQITAHISAWHDDDLSDEELLFDREADHAEGGLN